MIELENPDENKASPKKPSIQTEAFGSSGTEIYGGYISEEYLSELTGTQRATEFDKMRRGDAIVKMILWAIKLPIKSADWAVNIPGEKTPEAEAQKKLVEYVFFEDFGQSFTKWIGEVATCVDFAYSVFETVHKISHRSPIGPHIGFRKVAFRSQKTIERWNMDENGDLVSIEQQADGDTSNSAVSVIPAEFLVHFCPEQEGDDYEGLGVLRSCYGAWKRKNLFLKLLAAGIEKYAIGTPIASIPAGKENSEERKLLESVLKKIASNQSNYVIKPDGWEISILRGEFDSEKVRAAINEENLEMTNSVLASFLMLGQGGGGGSRALSTDLSSFFGASIQYIADHIQEVISEKLIKPLIRLNLGGQKVLVELSCGSLKDDADSALATTLKTLVDGKVITPDEDLEKFIREKYKLPSKKEIEEPAPAVLPQGVEFAEGDIKKRAERSVTLIHKTKGQLQEVFKKYLERYANQLIDKIISNYDTSTDKSKYSAINGIEKSVPRDYIDEVMAIAAGASFDAADIHKGTFKSELKFSEFDGLPAVVKYRLNNRIKFLLATHYHDLERDLILQYQSSVDSTDSSATIRNDLIEKKNSLIAGPLLEQGPSILSTDIVNSATIDAVDENEVESWTFYNSNPKTELCLKLTGRTFSPTDPDMNRFRPPLHFGCNSILLPNKKGYKGNPKISDTPLSLNAKEQKQIQLAEMGEYQACECCK